MRFLLLLLALLPVAAVAQIETPSTGGGGGGGGTGTPYYGPFTNLTVYGTTTNALKLNSGVITSSLPAIDISQTWSNSGVTFTGLRVNVTDSNSESGSVLADLQVGGNSRFAIKKSQIEISPSGSLRIIFASSGNLIGRNLFALSTDQIGFSSGSTTDPNATSDAFFMRDAAATLQLGLDAATATAQTIKAHDGSGTDKAGASLALAGGRNTGGGIGGALITQTSLPGSGASQGSLGTRHYAYAGEKSLTDSVAAGLFNVSVPTNKYASIRVFVSIKANDGFGGWSVNTIEKNLSVYNDNGTVTIGASADTASVSHHFVGSETVTVSGIGTGSNTAQIQVEFISEGWSETPAWIYARWQIWINSDDIATVTPL